MAEKIDVRPATIVIKKDKVLAIKSKYGKEEFYLFPGGGVEFGETLRDAAIRETLEETGYKVEIIKPVYINEYIDAKNKSRRVINLFFFAKLRGKRKNKIKNDGGKIKQIEWISIDKVKKINIKPRLIKENLEEDYKKKFNIVRYNVEYNNTLGDS